MSLFHFWTQLSMHAVAVRLDTNVAVRLDTNVMLARVKCREGPKTIYAQSSYL
jgi:hypothetical protein